MQFPDKQAILQLFWYKIRVDSTEEQRMRIAEAKDQLAKDLSVFESIEELQRYIGTNNYEHQIKIERWLKEDDEEGMAVSRRSE